MIRRRSGDDWEMIDRLLGDERETIKRWELIKLSNCGFFQSLSCLLSQKSILSLSKNIYFLKTNFIAKKPFISTLCMLPLLLTYHSLVISIVNCEVPPVFPEPFYFRLWMAVGMALHARFIPFIDMNIRAGFKVVYFRRDCNKTKQKHTNRVESTLCLSN